MKKFIAKLSAVALLAALVVVPQSEAAGVVITAALDAPRTGLTVTLPAGVDLAAGDDLTLRVTTTADGNAVDISGAQATALTVDGNDEFAQTGNPGDANGNIVVTGLVGEPAAAAPIVVTLPALADNTAYTVSYTDSQGNFGAAMINTGTSNQVTVTATVEPTLTFSIGNGTDGNTALAFGSLTAGTFSEDDVNLTYATNAVTGLTISVAATGLKDVEEIGTSIDGGTTDTTATDYYKVSTAGAVAAVTFDTVDNAITAAGGRDMRTTQDVVTSVVPVSSTQFVTVGTQVAATTPAGNYSDTLTFSATATF